jgi:uncharacterized protein (DUF2147 family)
VPAIDPMDQLHETHHCSAMMIKKANNNMRIFIVTVFMLLVGACAQAQEEAGAIREFTGAWKNEAGSLVVFTIHAGEVRGIYQTNVGQPDKSKSFPVIGFAEGDQITFTVNFKGYGSMTAWVGQMTVDDTGKPYIKTMWYLTRDKADDTEKDELWQSVITGASNFYSVK